MKINKLALEVTMSNKKQSSIDWLEQQFNTIREQGNIEVENLIWQQAKEMHKEEVKMTIEHYHNSLFYLGLTNKELKNISEIIYKETFGGDNE